MVLKPFSGQHESRLEEQYAEPFNAWKANPNPQTTGALMKAVEPDINRGINAHVGQNHALIRSRAKQLTLKAFQGYDPAKARLGTHIVNQLQGLKRISRQQQQIISVPERVSLDQAFLQQKEAEIAEELGREPSTAELADRVGLSPKRIAYIRSFRTPLNEGFFAQQGEEQDMFQPAVQGRQSNAWQEAVYSDLDGTNKKIMEWTLGLHGSPQLSNQEIAAKLRITPGAVSQRKAQIQQLLNQEFELSPF